MYLKIPETLTDMMSELLNGQIDSWTEISSRASLLLNFSGHCCVCVCCFSSALKSFWRDTYPVMSLPPIKTMNSFSFPSTHSSLLSSTASSSAFDSHTHTPSFSWLWLLPQTRWKPSTSQPPSCWEEERFHAFLTFTLVSSQVCNFHHWVGGQSRKRKPGYRLCFSLLHYVFCIFACFYLFSHEPSFMFISFSGAYSTLLASLIGSNQNH